MRDPRSLLRLSRKGSALGAALFFFVVVTVAGTALLSMSAIHRIEIVRGGIDVRLLIAAEAALETKRGQLTLVAGVQDDWSALMPSASWNNLGDKFTVNGITVLVQAMPLGTDGNLVARLRGIAYGASKTRAVEYTVRSGSFADYALFLGMNNAINIGANMKFIGRYYSKGDVNLANNTGIEFFSLIESSKTVKNWTMSEPIDQIFKKGYLEYVPEVSVTETKAISMDVMAKAASIPATGYTLYANTRRIQLVGNQILETYMLRTGLAPAVYTPTIRARPIPDNGVIYISSATVPAGQDTLIIGTNNLYNPGANNVVEVYGYLDNTRVTIASEHTVNVINNIYYKTLYDNPDLRRYANKELPAALNFREMLGLVSATNIYYERPDLWTPLPAANMVTDDASYVPPDTGHYAKQYVCDGVYLGYIKTERGAVAGGTGGEFWLVGGMINGTQNSDLMESFYDRRNYATDYRLQFSAPPYFPRAYGASPTILAGTWRTYEL